MQSAIVLISRRDDVIKVHIMPLDVVAMYVYIHCYQMCLFFLHSIVGYTVEPLYCGHLGDIVKCPV